MEELLWQIIRKYFETERYNNSHATTKNSAYLPGLTNKLKKISQISFLDGVLILLIKCTHS